LAIAGHYLALQLRRPARMRARWSTADRPEPGASRSRIRRSSSAARAGGIVPARAPARPSGGGALRTTRAAPRASPSRPPPDRTLTPTSAAAHRAARKPEEKSHDPVPAAATGKRAPLAVASNPGSASGARRGFPPSTTDSTALGPARFATPPAQPESLLRRTVI